MLKLEIIQNEILKNSQKINQHDDDIETIFKYLKKLLNPSNQKRNKIGYEGQKKT
jgi:cupin superfamily acireductone dioxygenase involved in methionine salvage